MARGDDKKAKKPESPVSPDMAEKRHGRSRRAFVKKLTIGGVAVVGASQVLPKKWMKPVVDSVVLPVHAQSTPVGTIAPNWVMGDDAPGGLAGIGAGTTNATDFLYDDGTDMAFKATLSPAAAVLVSIAVVRSGTSYGGDDFGTVAATANGGTGIATFGTFEPPNDDFGDVPGTGTITATFSAPGYTNSVIVLSVAPSTKP